MDFVGLATLRVFNCRLEASAFGFRGQLPFLGSCEQGPHSGFEIYIQVCLSPIVMNGL